MQLGRVSARAAAAAWLLACAVHAASARAELRLLAVEAAGEPGGARIELRGDGALPAREPFRLAAPSRLVLDLPGVTNATGRQRIEVGAGDVLRVRIGQHPGFLRIVLDLAGETVAAPRIERGASGLALAFGEARLPAVAAEPPAPAAPAPPPPAPAPAPAAEPAPEPGFVRVYGVELQSGADRDRVLVFAERAVEAELVTIDAGSVELRLPGTVLEESAARRIKPDVGGAVSEVLAFRPLSKGAPEVRIRIQRSPGVEPELSRRGAILAVEFPLPEGARDTGITLSFVDTELAEVVRDVAKATGASFIYDDRLRGRVSISVGERVSNREALEILNAALLSKGFAAVPSPGGALRILPAGDSATAAPLAGRAPESGRVAPVTTLVRLHNAAAKDLVASLDQLAGNVVIAAAFEPTNSVILAGSEERLQRYVALVQSLDDAESVELAVISLRHRDAEEIAGILAEAAPKLGAPPGPRRVPFEVWHDERSNTVLMRAPAQRLAELRAWIAELDQPPAGHGEIRVIRLLNADAAKLAETLQKLGQGDARAARGFTRGEGLAGRSFHVAAHESTGALLVQADPATHAIVREVVEEIDRRPPSIAVDVLMLEISTSDSLALGFDAFLPFGDASDPDETFAGAFSIQSAPGGVFRPVTDPGVGFFRYAREPLVIPIIGPGGIPTELVVPREIVQITAAEGIVEARTLLRPHLVALSGEEHELTAGDNVPVLIGATTDAGEPAVTDPLTIRNDIERRDVGTILRVTPTAGQAGDVRLELEVEASRLREIPAAIATRLGPVIQQRKLQAVTRLEHGQWAVLGMALDDELHERDAGVPFLKDIPILGWWARSTVTERMKRSLIIAVQAGIERSPEQRLADSVRHRLAFERTLARRGELRIGEEDGYALLVTTRGNEVEAHGVASALEAAGARGPRVVAWDWDGEPRFDVYVGGFATIREAGAAAEPLVAEGWKPEVVALPPEASAVPAKAGR
jgi:general secretion pathway protein D